MNARHAGGCHCGAIRIEFATGQPLAPRACQCRFCRKQGARSVSDPEGSAVLAFAVDPIRYRFASQAADYLLCAVCGVYVGAMVEEAAGAIVTLNLNNFDEPHSVLPAVPVSYDGESAGQRAASRRARWTPLTIVASDRPA
jgi:hypothetical protein